MTHRIELPPFYCPIAPVMHPRVQQVEIRSIAWAMAMGLCSDERHRARLEGSRSAQFFAGMTHEGVQERLEIATQWTYWAFAVDDKWCDDEAVGASELVRLVGRVLRTMETLDVRPCQDDPYLLAIHDLAVRYHDRATPIQMQRWVEANRLWLMASIQQHRCRARRTRLTMDEYLAVRLRDAGGPPLISMFEFVDGSEVPGYEMDSLPVRAVTAATETIGALDNDLVSRHKELIGRHDDYNVIDVLRREHGWSFEQATREAVALRDRVMCLFLRLRETLVQTASVPLRAYLANLGHCIRNNIDWSLTVPRYDTIWDTVSASVAARLELSANIVDEPSNNSMDPPPYPAIAWWWEQLTELKGIEGRCPRLAG